MSETGQLPIEIVLDVAREAADQAVAVIHRKMALVDDPRDKFMVAAMCMAHAVGMTGGTFAAAYGLTGVPDSEVCKALIDAAAQAKNMTPRDWVRMAKRHKRRSPSPPQAHVEGPPAHVQDEAR